ncbi:MAG: carboxylating nicotinate-nucleotide diphosphorylase [Herbaspirillum sp.]|uniref:carboxylating nicotinate-nucleotide diphosphorylase n=1 Tax=Herbaspirillum sp. TaxID=1890675 RepID=UPI0025837774|nr:carboxylating nicotinate-nucleotide diphosphorylase [Herbaspirillum sp.]MCP3656969.1 carboxylating nicotinate-nucleotide diphosphorylase [Herbaspirillum sp.]MCP3949016.1 carboxylating nicotinate-nucleotide diphosphorylase [Herbaspirillum sp.]MCP4030454.1 carboxylating nicotinate-nucleotide diphosphorylase [Herbaspirillum sp.]MCP4557806.1 carboxylating nicotinate-nucleotide diphosphorylase [Herbaspirillum sp.]
MFDDNETLEAARARNVRDALYEDIGRGDWTAQLVAPEAVATAQVTAKESAVLCGSAWFDACFHALDAGARIEWRFGDGDQVPKGAVVCTIASRARALLSAERPALNFLQMLSAVATRTRQYVQAIEGVSSNPKGCLLLDTRKTLGGLRQAQKYAVRVGGGANHRMALWDGILIKENHIKAAGGIAAALDAARALNSGTSIQIEVEDLDEMAEALQAGATSILLDDFTLEAMRRAVDINAGRAVLEVSGGVDLDSVRAIAATGVDRISTGKLTKDICAIDLSLRLL